MFFKNKPVRFSRPPVEEPPEPITLRKLSHPSEDMFSELNPISNLSEIVHFKPTELLSQKSSTKNDTPETIRIPSNKPHFMGLVGSKLLRQNEINATFLCVKGIKYTNSFVLASYHLRTNHKNNNTLKKKIFIYLKRLKLCPTFQLVEGDLLPLSQTDVAFVRRASLQLVKNIRRGQWGKHLQDFNKYRALESLSSCSVKGMRLPRTAKKLNFRQFFACDKVGKYAVRQIRKLPHLSALNLNNESLLDVLKFQNEVSEALKEQKNLQDITLHCYYNQEFDHRRILPPIVPGIALWSRLTELSIFNSSEDSTIHLLLDNMPTFRNLKSFTYSEVRSNPAQFPLFQCLKELVSLVKLSLSITLPDAINEEEIGAKLFQSLCFPMNLEHLSLTITGTKPWKFLQHATNSQGFFTAISRLGKLTSFAISVATYTFVDYIKQEEQEILISFLFFNNIVTSLSRQVTDLSLSLFQPVLMSNSPLTNDKLFYIISRDLKNLKNLTLNLLGINLTPKKLDPPVLSRLKTLTLYNLSLPFSSLNLLEAVHIEELNCWIAGEVDLESAVLFLREVNFLTSLKILQLQFSKLNYAKFTQSLMLELAKIFLNLKGLEDFNLGLTPLVIEKLWGEWLVQLCHCKKGLRFCNMKFNNYQIVKEYFAVTLKDS